MGVFQVPLQIGRTGNGGDFETVEAMVDTGATHSIIPASVLHRLGIEPKHTIRLRLADGGLVERPAGTANFSAVTDTGERAYAGAMVVFGAEGQYLMGATTLESLGMAAAPVRQTLTISYGYGR